MRSPSLSRPSRRSRESSGSVRARWLIALAAVALAIAGAVFLHSLRRVSPVALRPLVAADFPHVRWISTEELAQKLDGAEERKILLLDVRTEEEFEVSHLESALRVEPGTTDFTYLALSPDALVVAYCSVGYRSAAVVDAVRQAGFEEVFNLEGGLFQWANEGRRLSRHGERVTEVHPYDEAWGRLLRPELRAPLS